jgi:quercetin dioxygenase-like cupin family protein
MAEQTKADVVAAVADELEGPLIELCERVARRAGVSAATVRKLFPRREALLAAGVDYVITSVPAPAEPAATSAGAVVDAVFDYFDLIGPERLWAAYRHADESPALRDRVERIEQAVRPLISKLGGGDRSKAAFAKTLLDPLAYWRLRSSGIAAKTARTHTATALAAVISPKRKGGVAMHPATPGIINRRDGERMSLGGADVIFKIDSGASNGAFSICETTAEPGRLIPPHLHDTEDEFSYVVEGRIGVLIGNDEYVAETGSWVVKPRGIPHTYWNPGPEPARLIEIITPAGFEGFFRDLSQLLANDGPPDVNEITATAARYHHRFLPELEQPLLEKHSLRLIGT